MCMNIQQNDPGELIEVLDAEGRPTGRARTRAEIHIDGDWHRAFHCWIVRNNGREVVLQRRSLLKDTYAGLWDAAAAGHWRFGESAEEASREISEELGLDVPFEQLTYRGRERAESSFPSGLIDREFHEVYVLASDAPLDTFRPDPSEVMGMAAFDADALLSLTAGNVASIDAVESVPTPVSITREDLVPYPVARLVRMLGRT
jgi:isopentenyldiphosphate isomerase